MLGNDEKLVKARLSYNFEEVLAMEGESTPGSARESLMGRGETMALERNERPLAGRGNYWPPEETFNRDAQNLANADVPEEAGEEETGPLEQRIDSKTWKTRAKAYEEIANLLRNTTDLYSNYASSIVKFISDVHPNAQERGLEILQVYLINVPQFLLPMSENLVKTLIEKCVSSTKGSIKNFASAMILDFFAEHKDSFEGFNQGLLISLNNKNLKVQGSAIIVINSLISSFGVQLVSYKPFLPSMEKLAGNSNPSIRSEALNFYKECYKWVRELILPSVNKLKKAQIDELQKSFEEIQDFPSPTRYLKHEEFKAKAEASRPKKQQIDIYEIADAKDIFVKYNEKWAESVLEMDKWIDKKQALEILNAEANYPKLAEKSPAALVAMVKRLINDSNVNVMIQSMRLIGLLAKGQRRYFELYAKQFFSIFLSKLKEKKTQVIQETFAALENLLFSINLEQVTEDIREALEDKTPVLKINTTLWLIKIYSTLPSDQLNKSVKIIVFIVKKNIDDSTADVRTESLNLLSLLYKKYQDITASAIKDLPLAKLKKIEGFGEGNKEEVEDQRADEDEEEEKIPRVEVKNPAKLEKILPKIEITAPVPDRTSLKPARKESAKKEPPKGKDLAKAVEEDIGNALSVEEAESIIIEILSREVLEKLKETSWKDKVEGLQQLTTWVSSNEERLPDVSDSIFVILKLTVKEWKENNVVVNKSAFELIRELSVKTTISKRSAYIVLNSAALDKLSDSKLIEAYTLCLLSLSEAVTPKFVVSMILKNTAESNKPKVVSECLNIICKIIIEFGVHKIVLKELIDYLKSSLAQANPVIKKSAQMLTVKIYSYLGPSLLPLLSDVKEATLKALQEEFERTPIEASATFKKIRDEEESKFDPNKVLDDVIPRANISSTILPALKKLSDQNWKTRKEGLENIEEILDKSGKRILPAGLDELFKSLKGRLDDPNKAIVRHTLGLLSKLAECLGAEAVGFSRVVIPGLLSNLADKQSLLRQDALATIDKWSAETGADNIVIYVSAPLMLENPELRTELLNWLLAHKEIFPKCDLKPMAPGIINCLQDKSVNIRNAAELLFGEVVELTGFDAFNPFLKDIKPAVMSSLKQVFEKYKTVESPLETSGSKTKSKLTVRKPSIKTTDPENRTPRSRGLTVSDIRIIDVGDKEKRLEFDARYKWSVEELRPDYLEKLKEQLKAAFSPDLYLLMFNSDFKKQSDAAAHLTSLIKSQGEAILDYLDLFFKWAWIELVLTNNTQIYKAVLELDQLIVSTLESFGYILNDAEAGLFLPVLCEKSGQNNAAFRQMIRTIIHSTCKIYSADKVFTIVLQGLGSKNARSKVECLGELGSLILDYGIEIATPKDIKQISKQVNSPDTNVRTAAVDAMTEVYKIIGDKTWGMLGEVQDKVRGILDQRFRTVKVKNPPIVEGRWSDVKQVEERKSEKPEASRIGGYSKMPIMTGLAEKFLSRAKPPIFNEEEEVKDSGKLQTDDNARLFLHRKQERIESPFSRPEISPREEIVREETKQPKSIQEIRNAFKEKKQQMMMRESVSNFEKVVIENEKPVSEVCELIKRLENGEVTEKVDSLQALNEKILENLEKYTEELKANSRNLCGAIILVCSTPSLISDYQFSAYFFKVIQKLCFVESFVKELEESDIISLCERLLLSITVQRTEQPEQEIIVKSLNLTLLKILELALINEVFPAFLTLLTRYKTQRMPKITQILIKCTLKLTKSLQSQLEEINLEKMLLGINQYLISNDGVCEELGVKTMKTIINELVRLLGESIWQYFESVRDQISEESNIESWITMILGVPSPMSSNVTPSITISKSDPLDEIFFRLATGNNFALAFKDLQDFSEKNPGINIQSELDRLPPPVSDKVKLELKETQKRKETTPYNFSDMQSRLAQMKMKYGHETSHSATSSTCDLVTKGPSKPEGHSTTNFKSRIQKFSKK